MDWGDCVTKEGVATLRCIPMVFQNILNAALIFSGITALAFIILSGFKLMYSGGDPKRIQDAHKTLTFAIIGLVLILASFFIVNMISYFTGVECIKFFGFDNCK